MKRTWPSALAAMACAATLSLSAQTPPAGGQTPPTGGQTPSTSASKSSDDKVTVTGCLERASGSASSPTGTSGAAGASSSSAKFVLNNASSGSSSSSASSPGTAGTAGAASASKSASAGSSYQLDGDDSKLTPHVGHKVEISGTVDSGASAGAKKLKVDAVKMIASSCTP